jgi:DNA processing protein
VVVGTGLARVYPPQHHRLFDDIVQAGGALVSEFTPTGGGQPNHFPQRNRTIAGLSDAVALIRGGPESGARSTLEAAARAKRPCWAVPGNVGDELSVAPNRFLADGLASALVDGARLVEALGAAPRVDAVPAPTVNLEELGGDARAILAKVALAARHIDELAQEAALNAPRAAGALLELELAGLVRQRPGMFYEKA